MIAGLGTDIVEVHRIAVAMQNPRFLPRILTRRELNSRDHWSPLAVAGRWAAKEAAAKAVPQWNHWHDVEVLNDSSGRPVLSAQVPLPGKLHCTISHERTVACATVIWELTEAESGSAE